jgi:PAS domain-containing protein
MQEVSSAQDDLRCFDNARFGVIKINLEGNVEYANKWAVRLLGLEPNAGVNMGELLADEASVQTFAKEVESRRQGLSGEYTLKLKTRHGKGKDIRVQVLGTPVIGLDGKVRSTIGIFFNLEFDDVIAELRGLGEAATDANTLFSRLTEALARIFSFDALVISLFEEDGRYSRVFFRSYSEHESDPDPARMTWERPWIRLTEAQRTWMLTAPIQHRIIGDFPAFLEDPLWAPLRAEPATLHFLNLRIMSIMGLLVREAGNVVASLSLLSKQRDFYNMSDLLELDSLPLDKCILAVLHNIRRHEMEFHFNLLRQLLALPTVRDMSEHLVKAIGTEYKLSHVSLSRVNWSAKRIQLHAQWVGSSGRALPEGYEQPIEQGIAGAVAREGKALYIQDVASEPRYVAGALDSAAPTGAQFCWPVFSGESDKRVAWVFNIEDVNVDSLSPREQRSLATLAVEVGGLLQRMNDLAFLKATFASTSDPVVVIDNNGGIKKINPAAGALFDVPPPHRLPGNIADYFDDKRAAGHFLHNEAAEAELVLRIGATEVPVLISSCSLPEGLGGRVLLIKDMRPVRRMEELKYLGQVSQEVSIQAQTPLALVSTWVHRLNKSLSQRAARHDGSDAEQDNLLDLTTRIGVQLKRIQRALSQLSLYDQPGAFSAGSRIPISPQCEVEGLLARLPPADRERIAYVPDGDMEINGDPIHFAFVLETSIAFLLRHLPDGEQVTIRLTHDDSSGCVECCGYDATTRSNRPDVRMQFTTQLSDKLGLAETALRSIMAGFDGSFERRSEANGLTVITVRAPLARSLRATHPEP